MAMNFTDLKDGLALDSVSGKVGKIVGVNLLNNEIVILVDEKTNEVEVAKLENVTFLARLGYIGSQAVHNHDVIMDIQTDKHFEIVEVGTDRIQLHQINKKLERVMSLAPIAKTDLPVFEGVAVVVGNINELEPQKTVDFNIVIVRDMTGGEFNGYYYACNNKKHEEVDLIKVVFIGSTLLKEEDYERVTVSHEEYLDMVTDGDFVEVNPNELMNYVTGRQSFARAEQHRADDVDVDDFFEDDENFEEDDYGNVCDDCGCNFEDCECEDEDDEEDYEW